MGYCKHDWVETTEQWMRILQPYVPITNCPRTRTCRKCLRVEDIPADTTKD